MPYPSPPPPRTSEKYSAGVRVPEKKTDADASERYSPSLAEGSRQKSSAVSTPLSM